MFSFPPPPPAPLRGFRSRFAARPCGAASLEKPGGPTAEASLHPSIHPPTFPTRKAIFTRLLSGAEGRRAESTRQHCHLPAPTGRRAERHGTATARHGHGHGNPAPRLSSFVSAEGRGPEQRQAQYARFLRHLARRS